MLAEAATIGGAKLALMVRLYLGLIAPSRERPSVTEDGVIILLPPPIFIAGGVPRFMKALSIYEAGDDVKRKIETPYLNRQIGGKGGDNKNSHCSLNELEKT